MAGVRFGSNHFVVSTMKPMPRIATGIPIHAAPQKASAPDGGPMFNSSMAKFMKEYAIDLGIQKEKIVLEEESLSTMDHPKYLEPIFKNHNIKKVVLVTSKFHSKRVHYVFNKYFKNKSNEIDYSVIYAKDNINYSKWWTEHESIEKVVIEFLKSIVYKFIYIFK